MVIISLWKSFLQKPYANLSIFYIVMLWQNKRQEDLCLFSHFSLLSRSFKFSAIAPVNNPDVSHNSARWRGELWMQEVIRVRLDTCLRFLAIDDVVLTSSLIYYWTYPQQHGIYLFCTLKKANYYKRSFSYFKIFSRKPAFAHSGKHEKAIWRYHLSIQNEAISFFAMRSKDLWLGQSLHTPCNTWERHFSWNEHTAKTELNCEIYKSSRKC